MFPSERQVILNIAMHYTTVHAYGSHYRPAVLRLLLGVCDERVKMLMYTVQLRNCSSKLKVIIIHPQP